MEILPFLYLGSAYHAARRDMLDALGITALLNVSSDCPNHFEGHYQYKCIPVEDNHKADISSWFMEAIEYIGRLPLDFRGARGKPGTAGGGFRLYAQAVTHSPWMVVALTKFLIKSSLRRMKSVMVFEDLVTGAVREAEPLPLANRFPQRGCSSCRFHVLLPAHSKPMGIST